MNFDPRITLHFDQGFFLPNFVAMHAIGHLHATEPVRPLTFDGLTLKFDCTSEASGSYHPTKFQLDMIKHH